MISHKPGHVIPVGTSLILSLLLSVIFWLVLRRSLDRSVRKYLKPYIAPLILLLVSSSPLAAAETVRVAVFLNALSLNIESPDVLTVYSSDGERVPHSGKKIQIRPGNPGLLINGMDSNVKEIFIETKNAYLKANNRKYAGAMKVKQKDGRLLAINIIDVEEYLKGVVPVEISPDWHAEALKVQAVSSRTYALYQRESRRQADYDLVSTTQDQVYAGRSYEHPAANNAIEQTRGLVLTYHDHLALAMYHSTSAGPTEDAMSVWGIDLPYLKGVNCPFDRLSPRYLWEREIPLDRVQRALLEEGYPIGIIATMTPIDSTPSGRVARIRILHSRGEIILHGDDLRRILGYNEVPSTRFFIKAMGQTIQLEGRGWGHGVGLCQWGAKEMAEMGYSHRTILKYYYPGVKITPYSALFPTEKP